MREQARAAASGAARGARTDLWAQRATSRPRFLFHRSGFHWFLRKAADVLQFKPTRAQSSTAPSGPSGGKDTESTKSWQTKRPSFTLTKFDVAAET